MPPEGFFSRNPAIGLALAQGIEQFDLGVGQFDEDDGDTVVGFVLRRADLGAQRVAVLRRGGVEIRHRDGHMVQPSDHRIPRPFDMPSLGRPPRPGKAALR
jgi:hypothetical protein